MKTIKNEGRSTDCPFPKKEGKVKSMKTLVIGERELKLEYSFEAAEHKDTVQKMFNVVSGAYLAKTGIASAENKDEDKMASAMIDSVSLMVADIPHIVKTAFYSGLLENNPVSEEEAYELMKQYMKENKISYAKLFEDIKECMEDDGFFDLSGLTDMIQKMNPETSKRQYKKPQDHKKPNGTK